MISTAVSMQHESIGPPWQSFVWFLSSQSGRSAICQFSCIELQYEFWLFPNDGEIIYVKCFCASHKCNHKRVLLRCIVCTSYFLSKSKNECALYIVLCSRSESIYLYIIDISRSHLSCFFLLEFVSRWSVMPLRRRQRSTVAAMGSTVEQTLRGYE